MGALLVRCLSPNNPATPAGRPPGIPNISTRIQNLLESEEKIPPKVRQATERVVGKGQFALRCPYCGSIHLAEPQRLRQAEGAGRT